MNKINTDRLCIMSDRDVDGLYNMVKSQIYKLNLMMKKTRDRLIIEDLKNLQIEYCYVKRESDTRSNRKKAHVLYLESLSNKN